MRSLDELNRLHAEQPAPPKDEGSVDLLVVRIARGEHETPVGAELTPEAGVVGDRWAEVPQRDPERQVTLMMTRAAELVCDGEALHMPGDNMLVNLDLGEDNLPIGTRLRAGGVLLEVTKKPHLGCKTFSTRFGEDATAWVNTDEAKRSKLRGINCRVLEGGSVRVGDVIAVMGR